MFNKKKLEAERGETTTCSMLIQVLDELGKVRATQHAQNAQMCQMAIGTGYLKHVKASLEDLIADIQGLTKRSKDNGNNIQAVVESLDARVNKLIEDKSEQQMVFGLLGLRDKVNTLIAQKQEDINIDDVVQHKATGKRYSVIGVVYKDESESDVFAASDGESEVILRVGEVKKVLGDG